MEYVQDLVQYFDELFPVTDTIKKFYKEIIESGTAPLKILSLGSASGSLEFFLAKQGCDVTGIENFAPLLESANLKRRNQLLSIRFFTLPEKDIGKFLGKKFYNVVNILNNNICVSKNRESIISLFNDIHSLIADGGILILHNFNYELLENKSFMELPVVASTRARLYAELRKNEGRVYMSSKLQIWNEKLIPILYNEPVYPITRREILEFAKNAGFKKIDFYSDMNKSPFDESTVDYITILQA